MAAPAKRKKTTPAKRRPAGARTRAGRRRKGWALARKRLSTRWRQFKRRFGAYRRAFYWGAVASVWLVTGLIAVLGIFALDLPDTSALWEIEQRPSMTVLDRSGEVLARRGVSYGLPVALSDLPPALPQAVIAIEDRRFYYHIGIDPIGIFRAFLANSAEGHVVQGGSTITQQLAKNLFLKPERRWKRKIQEMMLAFWLEWRFSKDQILSLYLNRVYLGAGTYGVEAAAQRYFGKSATRVTLSEAALLAGLLKAPSRYAPTNDPVRAKARAEIVLNRMMESGFITQAQRRTAETAPPVLARGTATDGISYFIDWVAGRIPVLVDGVEVDLVIETTLDVEAQARAEKAVALSLGRDGAALGFSQSALISLDPHGAVVAMVGGRSYVQSQFNRAVQARRQPGSAIKPFVYLAALEAGWRPGSLIEDAPIRIGNWAPGNFSNRYEGQVTLTDALARSLNSAAVRLAQDVGPHAIIDTAQRLGIVSDLKATRSLPLGTSEVSLLELASAYAPFANGGLAAPPYAIVSIRTAEGVLLYSRGPRPASRVIAPRDVGAMNAMLGQVMRMGTGRKASLGSRPAAGKTGTSQSSRDAWFIGYTADLVTGVWVGNDDDTPMGKVTGGTVPAIIWKDYMLAMTKGQPVRPLPNGADPARLAAQGAPQSESSLTRFISRLFGGE